MNRLFFLLVLLSNLTNAQNWQKIDSVFSPSGVSVSSFTSPCFADLNNDNQLDLILGNTSGKVKVFINKNFGMPPAFSVDTNLTSAIYSDGLQNTNSNYASAIDLDNDLDLDLIIGGFNGLLLYENIGDQNFPILDAVETAAFSSVNDSIGTDGKPAFADLDNDGDYDLIVGTGESYFGGPEAGLLLGFRNIGDAVFPVYEMDNDLVAGLPDVGLNAFPTFGDLDADGDIDLLVGRDLKNLLYFRNDGDASAPLWTSYNSPFAGMATTTYWNSPALADLDNDSDLDLCYGNSDGRLFYYENTGTASSPSFHLQTDYFSVVKIEGSGATVSLGDYDGDGDKDLISGNWLGKIQYFENIGDADNALFRKQNTSFTNISLTSIYSTPRFLDVDKDSDLDIVSGLLNGKLYCYLNNNGSFQLTGNLFSEIDQYGSSCPAFADLDSDGDVDVLIGSDDQGSIEFYENDGSNGFLLNNNFMTGLTLKSYSHPTFSDLDNDGDFDLAVGRISGKVEYYINSGTSEFPEWTEANEIFEGIEVDQSAFMDFADMDNDGKKDLIIGEYDGNFSYFKNIMKITSVETESESIVRNFILEQNYPNPFNPVTKIKYSIPNTGTANYLMVELKIYDILGRLVTALVDQNQKPGNYEFEWNAGNNSSGVYYYELRTDNNRQIRKMILIK